MTENNAEAQRKLKAVLIRPFRGQAERRPAAVARRRVRRGGQRPGRRDWFRRRLLLPGRLQEHSPSARRGDQDPEPHSRPEERKA